ncbi:hypothetical protein DL96DRAFT_368531 [Flagelloscypha sp. PMI_526]|nr:hypothetical protein DL96DRAFT_368531 [Flagelloscypha sp. PMI_526]
MQFSYLLTAFVSTPILFRVNGGIMFGTGHAMAGFLVEPKAPIQTINIAKFRDGIWPAVEEANAQAPPASRIFKEMILVAKNPLPRAGKGTVMRKAALKMFEDDIEEAYRAMELGKSHQVKWNAEATRVWLSGEVKELVGRSVLEHEDLFQAGFDSLSATVLRQRIVGQMKESAEKIVRDSAEGVSSTLVFDYPTISTLTAFLMGGDVVSEAVPVPGAPSKQDVSFESAGAPPFRETIDEGDGNDIVIVGQSLRLPGGINDPSSFWEALISQRSDIITSIEATNRWDHASYYRNPSSSQPPQDGDIISTKAGFIDIESYDNQFFGISAAEAIFVSPSNRLVLEAAFTALEDANIPMRAVKGSNLAVFSSTIMDEGYLSMLIQEKGFGAYSRYLAEGLLPSFGSGRVSYLLDVHGPSITVDTACSGGLVAFDLAVKHLRYNPNAETALVIGAFTHAGPGHFSVLSDHGMISPNSRCATFSNGADGYVSSEGVSAMVLKTRSNAIRDGNRILAVIKASDVRHNGRTQGIAAPSIEGQVTVENRVLQMARLSPKDIHFVETHGTGTILGDSVEIRALNRVFANSHTPEAPLIIGAGKTVVGHTENVSGLVGIAKTILSFEHQIVPGIAHLTNENRSPSLDVTSIPLSISPIPATLPNNSRHSALVLANGISGTVAAAILQSPPPSSISSTHGSLTVAPFILSAKTPEALREYVKSYVDFCQQYSSQDAGSVCYTASVGREYYRYRFGCTVTSMKDLADKLTVDAVQPHMNGTPRPVILAFPGQGLHYPGMAAGLSKLPTFRTILEQNARLASKVSSFDVIGYMTATETENFSAIGGYSQLAIFVFQVTLGQWLQNIGIQISAVVGHSLGEIAASVISGALSFEMGLDLVIWREALLVSPASSPSGMALVAASEDEIRSLLQETPDLVIAIYNNPGSHVVSGPLKQIEAFVVATKAHGLRCTELNVAHGFHSPSIAGGLAGLETWSKLHSDQLSQPTIPFVSSTYGRILKSIPPNYWATNARDPVRFDQATFAIGEVYPQSIILDVGPQPAIYPILSSSHNFAPLAVTSRRGGDQLEALFSALAQLFTHGIDLDWNMVFRGLNMQTTSIPTYPFQRNRHYPNIRPTRNSSFSHSTAQTHSVEEITLPSSPTTTQADKVFVWAIQAVLGLGPTDTLDFSATLSGIGVDSISFAHIQSKVKVATGSVVPVDWFSDNYTLQDMVSLLK